MPQPVIAPYQTKSAVLFLIFNRPDTTSKVFEQIRAAKPRRLYIAQDAPRAAFPVDDCLCLETRTVVEDIDWECDVKTLFRETNAGCKEAVSSAITWFFDHEEEGIVLEDDCLPANSFFKFCDTLLEKYRNDTRIRHITGCNLQEGKKWGKSSYYFSNRTHVWGWASWKRVWNEFDKDLSKYGNDAIESHLRNIYEDPLVVECWKNIFDEVKAGKINSWAYPLDFSNAFNNGLAIIPNQNLVSNIGFGNNATHTTDNSNIYANLPLTEIDEITDPLFILPEKRADLLTLNREFNIEEKRRKENLYKNKLKKWAKSTLKQAAAYMFVLN